MRFLAQSKHSFNQFIRRLVASQEVIAPVKQDVARFLPITQPEDIYLETLTYFPAKEYFFRKQETLFQFKGTKLTVPKQQHKRRVFFGLRKCDLNAIKHQDLVFQKQAHDPYYTAARQRSILIGYHCGTAPTPYCFCESLNLAEFFDLMYYDRGTHFLVEVGSKAGQDLVQQFKDLFQETKETLTPEQKVIKNADRLVKKDFLAYYDHPGWQEGVDLCLSCTACTALCPTCYCFEIHDEVSTADPQAGQRYRQWSSCQVPEFTRVAGDHVFRSERSHRFKHRIYHQLEYFKEKHQVPLCVGCGRCIAGCPTRIDWVDILNRMQPQKAAKKKTKPTTST